MDDSHSSVHLICGNRFATFDWWEVVVLSAVDGFDGVVTKLHHGDTSVVAQLHAGTEIVILDDDWVD